MKLSFMEDRVMEYVKERKRENSRVKEMKEVRTMIMGKCKREFFNHNKETGNKSRQR